MIQIDPDYIEYFYDELKPNQHYIPASLNNLTEVMTYVLDKQNEDEMKKIIHSANSWCKWKMTRKQLAADMIHLSLRRYKAALDAYMEARNFDIATIESWFVGARKVDDLVECY